MNKETIKEPIDVLIEKAAVSWCAWKRAEKTANDQRLKIEDEIIKLTGFKKLEGSSTLETEDGNYKINLTATLNRKLDLPAYLKIEDQIPENMRPIKTKIELDPVGIKYLENNEPEIAAIIAPCITTKPAKTAVKVEFKGGV